jgi:hypothetical protein
MKKHLLFFALLFVYIGNAQVPSYVPTNGLVGYWPFSGNANDVSGNGNNGTNNGATLTTDRFGNANNAYSFDGNDIITADAIPFSNLTISIWYNINNSSVLNPTTGHPPTGAQLIGQGTQHSPTAYCDYSIGITSWNNINQFAFEKSIISSPLFEMFYSNANISYSNWVNLIYTIDSNIVKVYLNSILIDTFNTPTNFIQSGNVLSFGARYVQNSTSPTCNYFTGKLDDIGIWNRALTPQEVSNLYTQTTPVSCLPANIPTNGLVGYWPFCGNANDASSNGNNGTVNGATLSNDRFGIVNSSYRFDGLSNISVLHSASLNIIGDLTLSAWFLSEGPPNFRTNHMIIAKRSSVEFHTFPYSMCINYQYGISSDYKKPMFTSASSYPNGYQYLQSSQDVINGVWNHMVCLINGSNLKIYINNTIVLDTLVDNSKRVLNSANLLFGSGARPDLPAEQFVGQLDDIGIWNRALTQAEITGLYTTLGTNEITQNNQITVYPNPAKEQITIDLGTNSNIVGGNYKIINTLGQEVLNGLLSSQQNIIQLNKVKGQGIYFVKIYGNSNTILGTKKIIIQQ